MALQPKKLRSFGLYNEENNVMVKRTIKPHQIRFYRHNLKKKRASRRHGSLLFIIYLYAHCILYVVGNRVKHNGMFSDELEGKEEGKMKKKNRVK